MASKVTTSISTRFLDVDGVQVARRIWGSGQPLVLLNRFRGTLDNWDPAVLTWLARQHRMVAFDSIGIGESAGDTPPSVERMARPGHSSRRRNNSFTIRRAYPKKYIRGTDHPVLRTTVGGEPRGGAFIHGSD
ncbi:MAG TPA: hypothetical protein VKE51_39225 [Vicinamibacterales bacterium]|nr:hypothetical protein [Vicinamibacterales bacterium]